MRIRASIDDCPILSHSNVSGRSWQKTSLITRHQGANYQPSDDNLTMGTCSGTITGTRYRTRRSLIMNTIPAQEIKRRGIAAVDDLIAKGDLHIIRNNQPQYVVLSENRYQELLEAQDEAYEARVRRWKISRLAE